MLPIKSELYEFVYFVFIEVTVILPFYGKVADIVWEPNLLEKLKIFSVLTQVRNQKWNRFDIFSDIRRH